MRCWLTVASDIFVVALLAAMTGGVVKTTIDREGNFMLSLLIPTDD